VVLEVYGAPARREEGKKVEKGVLNILTKTFNLLPIKILGNE
jgi:hypothetical protein